MEYLYENFGKNFPEIIANAENYKFLQDGSLQLTESGRKALEETLNVRNFQGNAVVNYTEYEIPYTRIIEHKHFEFDTESPKTIISKEYSKTWKVGDEPYYPVNNDKNFELYSKYKELAKNSNVYFGGRLGDYKYYDMDDTIMAAIEFLKTLD